jgi:hypothetical protein
MQKPQKRFGTPASFSRTGVSLRCRDEGFATRQAQVAVRCDPQMRSEYLHRCHRKAKGVAKVAAARKLAIRLYWMLRTNRGYPEVVRVESSSRVPLVSAS